MIPRLVVPTLPDALSRRRLLETWIYCAHWAMILLALPWIVGLHPSLWWLFLAVAAGGAFHNILRASLIHHGTLDRLRSRGALLLILDSLVLMIGLWPMLQQGHYPMQQWLLVIPLEVVPRLGFERPRVSVLVMAVLTAILSGYEALGLRYHEDWKDVFLWTEFFVLIGIWGSLRARAIWQQQGRQKERSEHTSRWSPLTRQHRAVLRLVEEGLTNGQIAERLCTSPGTIKKHLDEVYKRLDVHDRDSAARIARKRGYLD